MVLINLVTNCTQSGLGMSVCLSQFSSNLRVFLIPFRASPVILSSVVTLWIWTHALCKVLSWSCSSCAYYFTTCRLFSHKFNFLMCC